MPPRKRTRLVTAAGGSDGAGPSNAAERGNNSGGAGPSHEAEATGGGRRHVEADGENEAPLQASRKELEAVLDMKNHYLNQRDEAGVSIDDSPEMRPAVAEVMRHMLFQQFKAPGIPVTKAKLHDVVTQRNKKTGGGRGMAPTRVVLAAQAVLAERFGLELAPIYKRGEEPAQDADGSWSRGTVTAYVMRSMLPGRILRAFVQDRGDDAHRGFTMTVLALLQMSGDKMREPALKHELSKLGLRAPPAGRAEGELGGVDDAIRELELRKYVEAKVETGEGESTRVLHIGPAAISEFGHDRIKGFINEMFKER